MALNSFDIKKKRKKKKRKKQKVDASEREFIGKRAHLPEPAIPYRLPSVCAEHTPSPLEARVSLPVLTAPY